MGKQQLDPYHHSLSLFMLKKIEPIKNAYTETDVSAHLKILADLGLVNLVW